MNPMGSLAAENLGTSKKSRWTLQVWKILNLVFWQEGSREGYRDDNLTLESWQPGECRGCAQAERYTGRQTDTPTPYSMTLEIRVEVTAEKREANKHPPADLLWRWLLQAGGLSAQGCCPVLFAVGRPRPAMVGEAGWNSCPPVSLQTPQDRVFLSFTHRPHAGPLPLLPPALFEATLFSHSSPNIV